MAVMDFARSAKAQDYHQRLTDFMVEFVFPAEHSYDEYRLEAGPKDHTVPPVVEVTSGVPVAKASSTGCPKVSYRLT